MNINDKRNLAGIIRKVDRLGRIVIPKEMRKSVGFNEGQRVEILEYGNDVLLRKANNNRCVLCGSMKNLTEIKSKFICVDCLIEIQNRKL